MDFLDHAKGGAMRLTFGLGMIYCFLVLGVHKRRIPAGK